MQFVDKATIHVEAGNGGDGIVSFRKEAYVPKGGPAGGDGGRGGNVVFVAVNHLSTLLDLRYRRVYKAGRGQNGMPKKMTGASADDLEIRVPVGTVIKDARDERVLADLVTPGQKAVIARGGRGGRGNCRFATSRNPAPQICERGEPGEKKDLICELKLLADVGLVGYPSVGKSTLLSVVSKARPEIADYPFTTMIPNLGVVSAPDGRSFVMADLPGLIKGASLGKGLGHQFLRHIERCRVIVHMVDMASLEGRDPYDDFVTINQELEDYNPDLLKRPMIILANKMDMPEAPARYEAFVKKVQQKVYPVSAYMNDGLKEPLYAIADLLDSHPVFTEPIADEKVVYRYDEKQSKGYEINKVSDGVYELTGERVERLTQMTSFSSYDALKRYSKRLKDMGIFEALREAGCQDGDTVRVLDFEFDYEE